MASSILPIVNQYTLQPAGFLSVFGSHEPLRRTNCKTSKAYQAWVTEQMKNNQNGCNPFSGVCACGSRFDNSFCKLCCDKSDGMIKETQCYHIANMIRGITEFWCLGCVCGCVDDCVDCVKKEPYAGILIPKQIQVMNRN